MYNFFIHIKLCVACHLLCRIVPVFSSKVMWCYGHQMNECSGNDWSSLGLHRKYHWNKHVIVSDDFQLHWVHDVSKETVVENILHWKKERHWDISDVNFS